jgi:hypothetical protein
MNDEPIFFSGFDACAFIQDLENQTNWTSFNHN